MALTYLGKDPGSDDGDCPTVWVDEDTCEIVLQGWRVLDEKLMAQIRATAPVPETETVVRLPARMASIVREACDVAESAAVR